MSKAIDFVYPKNEAIANIKVKLSSLGIEIAGEDTVNKGVGLKLSLKTSQSGSAIVIYFNAKSGKSTKIVPENLPDNTLKSLKEAIGTPTAEIAPSKTIIEKHIEQKSMPISLPVVLTDNQKGDFKKKIEESGITIIESKKTGHMDYCRELKENKLSLKISQFKTGKLLLQGANSPLTDRVITILEEVRKLTAVERALRYVPESEQESIINEFEKKHVVVGNLEKQGKEELGAAYDFLFEYDKRDYNAGIGLITVVEKTKLSLPRYNVLVAPFAKTFEGFIIAMMIKKEFYTLQQYKDNPDVAQIGNALRKKKFEKYVRDKQRNGFIVEKLIAVWEGRRCKEMHSDPNADEYLNYNSLKEAADRISEIRVCIKEAYSIIIQDGMDDNQLKENKKKRIEQTSTSVIKDEGSGHSLSDEHIGTDESGKGDYLGPLVIAGVYVDEKIEKQLIDIGVKDSKLINDPNIRILSEKIKKIVGNDKFTVVYINPEKYNELYEKMQNLNKLLAWGHARSIENILEKNSCKQAIADQFGDESFILNALMQHGKNIDLLQMPKAESDTAVAAASILARNTFITRLEEMSKHYGIELPKGASPQVEEAARQIVKKYGKDELRKVAKLHFKSTKRVLE